VETYSLSAIVCPHDTVKNVSNWIEFFVVLGQLAGVEIGYTFAPEFEDFAAHLGTSPLVYASPLDALRAEQEFGYLPVASPERSDEVVYAAREDVEGDVESFAGAEVAGVPGQFATRYGCTLLRERGLAIGSLRPYETCNEVLEALRRGEAERAILYKDFLEHLDQTSLEGVRVVEITDTGRFQHVLMLHPDYAELRGRLQEALARMEEHVIGADLVRDLGLGEWRPRDDIGALHDLQDC